LGGKCRNCKQHISFRYPLIEVFTAFGFLYLFTSFSSNFYHLLYLLSLFSILILIFVIDFEHNIIPDLFVFLGITLIFIFFLLTNNQSLFANIFAGFFSALLLLLIHLFTRGRGMGLGDVKFAVLGGMIVGLKLNLIWLFLSFLTGGIAGIILILIGRAGLKDRIAFGPFLIIGILLTLVFGSKFLFYLGF